jgi:Ca2+-transporting ATPase
MKLPLPPVWALSAEDTFLALDTSDKGLAEKEVIVRRLRFGENLLPRPNRLDRISILARQFSSPLVVVLLAAALLTLALDEWLEASVILLAVLVNAGLGFYQEYGAEHALEELETYVKERARVIRGGFEREIDSSLIVPGDILSLSIGARVPADARLVESHGLSVDESILTGESLPVSKQCASLSEGTVLAERTNMVYAGTLVVEGSARAIVYGTDEHTEIGRIAELVATTQNEPTPLQKSLAQLARFIALLVGIIVVLIFLLGLYRGEPLVDMLLMSVAIAVGAIPEALPIALTVILAIGLRRLAQKKGIMRSLAAAETLGSATVVMTDKTGTLTEAKMRLSNIFTLPELVRGKRAKTGARLTVSSKAVLEAALVGTNVLVENPQDPPEKWTLTGHPIEASVVRAGIAHGLAVAHHTKSTLLLPFNSTNKFSLARHEDGDLIVLGAPEIVLARAKTTKDQYVAAEAVIFAIAAEGKRLLGVATLPRAKAHKDQWMEEDVQDLRFLGVLVFEDPLRRDARESMQRIEALGASVVMLTGDLKGTALSVGRELGWDIDESNVLSGEELRALSDAELKSNLKNLRIFARVTPEDKLRIGRLYRETGEVVAMTGDGVNDAPALKAVDIGVALGSGSDVARATADLILLDDSFRTIVSAIEEGRRMLDNIRKTTVYLLSTSLNEVMLIGGALLAGLPLPLTALQIIWVNLFTESMPALSYAFEHQYDASRGARRTVSEILDREVRIITIGLGTAVSMGLFALYWALLASGTPLIEAHSVIFLCLSGNILVVAFSLRSLQKPLYSYNPFGNRTLNVSILISLFFIIATVALPQAQAIFGLTLPSAGLLGVVAAWLVANVILVELVKVLFRRAH